MYGFGGLGEVEVEIWSDVTMAGQRPTDRPNKKERQSYSAIRPWTAEMNNIWPSCLWKITLISLKSWGYVHLILTLLSLEVGLFKFITTLIKLLLMLRSQNFSNQRFPNNYLFGTKRTNLQHCFISKVNEEDGREFDCKNLQIRFCSSTPTHKSFWIFSNEPNL